jgi:type II secretory pathway pseudopilin PulG
MRFTKKINLLPLKPTQFFLTKKIRGGALYIAIIVSIIIGILMTLFILLASYNQRTATTYCQSVQLGYNLKSAFQIAQSAYFNETQNNRWLKNTTNDDSTKLKKIYWGAYLLISVTTKNRHASLSQSGLYGSYMSADTGLVVSDNSRPIGMSGAINFKANCYLPAAGIKPAYIEGQSYQASPGNGAFIKTAPSQIPELNAQLIKGLENQQSGVFVAEDSIVRDLPLVYTNSFTRKTVVWESGNSQLSNRTLKNNIKLIGDEMVVDSSCHFDNVLIICNKIRFQNGFKGKVHVIARDSITATKNCEFNFPSSFVLLPGNQSGSSLAYIQLGEACLFFGSILAINKSPSSANQQNVFIKLNATCEVNGFVYCSNFIHLQGAVNANVFCNKLLLKTPSAVYENHILACDIDPKKYSHLLAITLAFKQNAKLVCCQKMN